MNTNIDHFADLTNDEFDAECAAAKARPSDTIGTALRDGGLIGGTVAFQRVTGGTTSRQRVEVKCDKCRGTGRWVSFSGYSSGQCFACKGKGTITRSATYEADKAKREATKQRKEQEQANAAKAAVDAWISAHPAEFKWLSDSAPRFDFAMSLLQSLAKWHSLTDNQLAAVHRCMERDAQRAASKAAAPAPEQVSFPRIERLVREENLALHLGHSKVVMFQSGAVAVVAPAFGGGTYGIVDRGGALRRFRAMSDEVFTTLKDVEQRGLEAVREIGQATGRCCICGRMLTDEHSIEMGIGPVCAERAAGL